MIDDSKFDLIKNAVTYLNTVLFEALKERNSQKAPLWQGSITSTDAPEFKAWQEKATAEPPKTDVLQLNKPHNIEEIGEKITDKEDVMIYKKHKVEKRNDGRWQIRYSVNGKPQYVYGRTQSICCRNYDKKTNTAPEPIRATKLPNNGMLLAEYLSLFIELFREGKKAAATVRKDKYNVIRISKDIGHYRLKELDVIILQRYLNSISGDRQREHIYTILNTAFKKAVVIKHLAANPMLGVEIKKYQPKERESFTAEQEQKFINAIKGDKYEPYYLLMLYEGLRPQEVATFNLDCIKDKYVHIKNALDVENNIKSTKSAAGKRSIPLSPNLLLDDFKPLDVSLDTLRDNFKEITEKLGFNSDISLYNLRHTFITRCAEKGVHPKVTQKWAGHSTIEMTLKYYTHINSEWENKEAEKLLSDD